jgi:hypothetical protein
MVHLLVESNTYYSNTEKQKRRKRYNDECDRAVNDDSRFWLLFFFNKTTTP